MAQMILDDQPYDRTHEKSEYRIYAAIAYPILFIAVVIGRLLPRRRRMSDIKRGSVFQETAAAVHSIIPWVFSGR